MNHSKAAAVMLGIALLAALAGTASASHNGWWYDDDCGTSGTDPYFVPAGPPEYWKVHTSALKAYNSCHMYTATISASASSPVNTGNWYLPTNNSNYQGDYYVYALVPCETDSDHWSTNDQRYRRYRYGTNQGVTETYRFTVRLFISNCTTSNAQKLITEINGPPNYDPFGNFGYIQLIDKNDEIGAGKHVGADRLDYSPRSH